MPDKHNKFQEIVDVSMEFTQARDVDLLLRKILATAKRLANADIGSIYIIEDEKLRYHHTQNGAAQPSEPSNTNHLYTSSTPVASDSIPAYIVNTHEIINIADIAKLPDDTPYTLERFYEAHSDTEVTSVLAFPLSNNYGNVIGVIQLLNIHDNDGELIAIPEDDIPLVRLFANNSANAIERALATRARIQGIIQILTALRDTEETVAHVNRVGAYASEIYDTWARSKDISQETITQRKDILRMAAMLHDIGKLAVPAVIRKKPGKLDEDEYSTMKEHTLKGAQLLLKHASSEIEEVAAEIALNHHECWNGRGYPGYVDPNTGEVIPGYEDEAGKPRGKKGEEIPIFGRIVAISDVYDALSNPRVFREAWKEEDVLEKLRTDSGTHFDPEMIEAFFASLDTIQAISKRFPEA